VAVRISESEIQKLARLHRQVVRDIGQGFVGGLDLDSPSGRFSNTHEKSLLGLEAKSRKWAERNIERTYQAARRSTEQQLRAMRRYVPDPVADARFNRIHSSSLTSLLNDPVIGFMPGVRRSTGEVRGRIQLIKNQMGSLANQRNIINESIARVGLLGKGDLNTIRDRIVGELVGAGRISDNVYRNKFKMLGSQNLFSNIANVTSVTFSNGRGGVKHIPMDKYIEDLGRVKASQAVTAATRNTLLRHGHDLVRISGGKSKEADFCDMYAGKVFALTKEASMRWGVPHVAQLPNGGAPFHPNCRHYEVPYFAKAVNPKQREKDMEPPPPWALDRPMGEVQAIHYGSRKVPSLKGRKLNPLGEEVADWSPFVLERMRGEPIGRLSPTSKTFEGSLRRKISKRGVRNSSDLVLYGGMLNEDLKSLYLNDLKRSHLDLIDFRRSVKSAQTRFNKRAEGDAFPDVLSADLFRSAASSLDKFQSTRKGFNEKLQKGIVSRISKVRAMGVGVGKEASQYWTPDTPSSLRKDFNKTLSFFPTTWLLRSKKEGQMRVTENQTKKSFGFSNYRMDSANRGTFSIHRSHSRLPQVARTGIFLYLMALRVKKSVPELRAFEADFWNRLGPRERVEMLELLGHASSGVDGEVPELFAAGVQSVFGYNTDGLSRDKLNSFVMGTYVGVP